MTSPDEDLMVVPLNRLPSEVQGLGTQAIESDKLRIRKLLSISNQELYQDSAGFRFFAELGGDLMISAFACNFKLNGELCQDVVSLSRCWLGCARYCWSCVGLVSFLRSLKLT